ncbi:MAG: universal stress protein [Burkholderiales bacterium]|nr:universal stress protein [Burkholderiales bacterium]
MTYKTIAVWLDQKRNAPAEAAIALARECGAHLTGLTHVDVVRLPPHVRALMGEEVAREQLRRAQADAAACGAAFEALARREGIDSLEVRQLAGDPVQGLATSARYADLVIMGQTDADLADGPEQRDFPDHAILATGRPTLLIPYAGSYPVIGEHAVVAWNATRESTRAVTDALPLLKRAKKVTVIVGDAKPGAGGHGQSPGADIALYLARHGVRVEVSQERTAGIDVGSLLLSRVSDLGADLLVMGGYGHSRMRELVLGGVTRTILREMTVPVMMSH